MAKYCFLCALMFQYDLSYMIKKLFCFPKNWKIKLPSTHQARGRSVLHISTPTNISCATHTDGWASHVLSSLRVSYCIAGFYRAQQQRTDLKDFEPRKMIEWHKKHMNERKLDFILMLEFSSKFWRKSTYHEEHGSRHV